MARRPGLGALAIVALAGCGGEGPPATTTAPAPALSAAELRSVDQRERAISRYCASWVASRTGGEPVPRRQRQRAFGAVDELIALVRQKPRAAIGRTSDVRLRVGDIAESVEGANCDPALEGRLDQGIAAAVAAGGG